MSHESNISNYRILLFRCIMDKSSLWEGWEAHLVLCTVFESAQRASHWCMVQLRLEVLIWGQRCLLRHATYVLSVLLQNWMMESRYFP